MGKGRKPSPGVQGLGLGCHRTSDHCVLWGAVPPTFPDSSGGTQGSERSCNSPEGTRRGWPSASPPRTGAHCRLGLGQQRVRPPLPPQANLPLLQRELLHCARLAKQTPAQYLAQHEQLLLDANASSPIDSSELLLEVNENGKRRTPDRYTRRGRAGHPVAGREVGVGGAASPELPLVPQLSGHPTAGPTEHGPTLLRSVARG